MQVIKNGKYYKASRVTGPAHNFLALSLTTNGVQHIRIEPVSLSSDTAPAVRLDSTKVLEKAIEGVSQANAELGTDYHIESMQYVPTDSYDLNAYIELAKSITHAAAKWPADSTQNTQESAIA